jgi:hypothetical protein
MPASLAHMSPNTPMGANLIADGATFCVWAPNAHSVHVIGDFNDRRRNDASLLTRNAHGHWCGFIPGVRDWQRDTYFTSWVMAVRARNAIRRRAGCKPRFQAIASSAQPIFHGTRAVTSRRNFMTS